MNETNSTNRFRILTRSALQPINFTLNSTKKLLNYREKYTSIIGQRQEKHQRYQNLSYIKSYIKEKEEFNLLQHFSRLSIFKNLPKKSLLQSKDLNDLNFPILSYKKSDLIQFSKIILISNPVWKLISKTFNLKKLIQIIESSYNNVPYHNFSHGFSVLLMLHQCYNRSDDLKIILNEKKWFFVLIAGLVHDINHPGTNNNFQVKKNKKLGITNITESYLEIHHLNTFWTLLKENSQVNFLQGYPSYEMFQIKRLITRLILATDISKHFHQFQKLKNMTRNKNKLKEQKKMIIIQQLFHACDVGNPCLDFDNYMNWAVLVSIQFDQIAQEQLKLQMQVTKYLKYTGINNFYIMQIGFCSSIVLPLWKQLSIHLNGLDEFVQNILTNIKKVQIVKQKLQQQ